MTLIFATIPDINWSRQRIMDGKLKMVGRVETRILHRPPFDFAAVKRIHAYLAPRSPSRSLLRVRRSLFWFRQLPGCVPAAVSKTRNTSLCTPSRGGRSIEKVLERARKRVRRVLCKFMRAWSLHLFAAGTTATT